MSTEHAALAADPNDYFALGAKQKSFVDAQMQSGGQKIDMAQVLAVAAANPIPKHGNRFFIAHDVNGHRSKILSDSIEQALPLLLTLRKLGVRGLKGEFQKLAEAESTVKLSFWSPNGGPDDADGKKHFSNGIMSLTMAIESELNRQLGNTKATQVG